MSVVLLETARLDVAVFDISGIQNNIESIALFGLGK